MGERNLALFAQHLSLSYGRHLILNDISLTLKPGAVTALIGPNGAGKSSLLRLLAHLDTPPKGTVSLGQIGTLHSISPVSRARLIGWVGDHDSLPFAYTVFETVLLGRYPWHQGTPSQADDRFVYQALDKLEITHLAHRDVTSLSSGERQKTMIARLMAGDPPVMLLDEPLANLDIGSSLKLLRLLRLMAQEGATVCLTIHDLSLAYRFADHVICLAGGKIQAEGPAKDVVASTTVVQAFGVHARIAPGLVLDMGGKDD